MSISGRVPPLLALLVLTSYVKPYRAVDSLSTSPNALPPSVLHHILYVEPNLLLQQLGNVSDTPGSLKRTFLDAGHRRAAALLQKWMTSAGMTTWVDTVGNVRGRALSQHPTAPSLMIGSHYDTVIDGGIYDGALGIIVGIAAVKALVLEASVTAGMVTLIQLEKAVGDLGIEAAAGGEAPAAGSGILDIDRLLMQHSEKSTRPVLRRPVEIVAFSDEEGVRFQSTFLGSKALAGTLVRSGGTDIRDAQGETLLDALRSNNLADTIADIERSALPQGAVAEYIEVHLEQGPVLEEAGSPLGVVTGIAGQSRLLIIMKGVQGHAGTVPMRMRKDPMAGAAEVVTAVESLCRAVSLGNDALGNGKGQKGNNDVVDRHSKPHAGHEGVESGSDPSLVCTVGSLTVWPGASNVIPGAVNVTLDVRSQIDSSRETVVSAVQRHIEVLCERRGLRCGVEMRHAAPAVHCDPHIINALEHAVAQSQRERLFHSSNKEVGSCSAIAAGSENIATCINNPETEAEIKVEAKGIENSPWKVTPLTKLVSGAGHDAMAMASVAPIGMLFVRCAGGISHSPEEFVAPEDVASGTAALLQYLKACQLKERK